MAINGIYQGLGANSNYTVAEEVGVTTISFTGTASSVAYDVNTANIPRGGVIVSVASSAGFGFQPLVAAGATVTISAAGTVSSIPLVIVGLVIEVEFKQQLTLVLELLQQELQILNLLELLL